MLYGGPFTSIHAKIKNTGKDEKKKGGGGFAGLPNILQKNLLSKTPKKDEKKKDKKSGGGAMSKVLADSGIQYFLFNY